MVGVGCCGLVEDARDEVREEGGEAEETLEVRAEESSLVTILSVLSASELSEEAGSSMEESSPD